MRGAQTRAEDTASMLFTKSIELFPAVMGGVTAVAAGPRRVVAVRGRTVEIGFIFWVHFPGHLSPQIRV